MPPDYASPARPDDPEGWVTIRRFLPYLWPADNPSLRRRIAGAMVFVLLAKGTMLALPFAYKGAVDAMTTPANETAMVALAFVIAYAAGRLAAVVFDNLRNITFERVGQDATRQLAEDTFRRLHQLSLRFHLARRTGEVTKTIDRGTKSIDTMLYFLLFNIAPTAVELVAVGVIFYLNFGWELVAATALTVAAYITLTRKVTEWRNELRRRMNELDGTALARSVDSLLNYETVKYFGAETREQARYAESARSYADAAVRSQNSLGLLNIGQAVIMNLLMGGAMGFTVWQWSKGVLTTGDLVLVNTYLIQLFRPLDMLGMVYRTVRQGLIDMAEMFRLIDTETEVKDAPAAPALVVRQPTVVFDDVHFGYEPDARAERLLDRALRRGQFGLELGQFADPAFRPELQRAHATLVRSLLGDVPNRCQKIAGARVVTLLAGNRPAQPAGFAVHGADDPVLVFARGAWFQLAEESRRFAHDPAVVERVKHRRHLVDRHLLARRQAE